MPLKLNAFSGGSVTLSPASTASDFTHTLPAVSGTVVTTGSSAVVTQAMLSTNVAGNGPAFSAYLGSNQSIPNNVYTKLNINTESFDTNSCYDTTLYRFTPNVAGYYFATGRTQIPTSNYAIVVIYKNGTIVKAGVQSEPTNASYGTNVSGLIYLNGSTDYIELFAYQAVTGGGAATAAAAAHATFFDAFLARAA